MKQLIIFVFLFFAINFCFAFGDKEREAEIEQEQCIMAEHLKKNPNVKEVDFTHHDKLYSNQWIVNISLKNDGCIKIMYCSVEQFFNGHIPIWQVGEFELWNRTFLKEGVQDNKYLCPTLEPKLALSKLLQLPFESIDDYINNYEEINVLLEKLSFETKLERTQRRDMQYTDDEFIDYFGNFETDEVYGMLFARPITEKGTEFWVR